MFKAKIFTAGSNQDLEKQLNEFLGELTNAEILHVNFQINTEAGSNYFFCMVVYQINHGTTSFGSA